MTPRAIVLSMRPGFAIALALALWACDHHDGPTPPRADPSAASTSPVASATAEAGDPIAWQLSAEPAARFPMTGRGAFSLWIGARNDGARAADTRRNSLQYLVNGHGSMMLSMAFGNGLRDRRWSELPPGESLRESRGGAGDPSFGTSLFPAPGDYDLVLRQGGHDVASLHVRVDSD